MIQYAFCRAMPGEHAKWTLTPWKQFGLEYYDTIDQVPTDRVLISSHHPPWREPLKSWIQAGRSYIEIEYGYWGPDTPRRETRRVTYNGHHNMHMVDVPYSRQHLFTTPKIKPWRQSTGKNRHVSDFEYVLGIQPVESILQERTGETLDDFRSRIETAITPYWDGHILWRRKVGAKFSRFETFQQQVFNAHAVVGERTMACVESCLLGVPGYTVDDSMATLLMGSISELANPKQPDREQWWEHICWSQFNRNEFDTDIPARLVEEYQIYSQGHSNG